VQPQNINFGGGVPETAVNPLVLAVTLFAALLILLLPRKWAAVPLLVVGLLIPINQILVVAGVHFPMLRLLAIFGLLRVLRAKITEREQVLTGGMNGLDWAVIILLVFTLIDGALLWTNQAEVVFQLGNLCTVFGVYFALRHFVRDEDDIKRVLKVMACLVTFIALIMIPEHLTGINEYYQLLGGARATMLAQSGARDGVFRAQGCFAQPILAGTFGGFMVPLFVGLWKREKRTRTYALLGMLGSVAIPFLVASSTALFALLAGIGALFLWPIRRKMRLVRWGIVVTLLTGQIYMKSPVWHLIDDVSLSQDSSSFHRYFLVDQCIRHFFDWALIGTKSYASWGWDMWDLSNQYVGIADTAGLIPFIAFLAIIVIGFKYVGRARNFYEGDKPQEFFVWAIGACFFANVVGFFGIQYWDQVIVAWYLVLAIIAAVALPARAVAAAPARAITLAYQPRNSFASAPSGTSKVARPLANPPLGPGRTPVR
jgi:hypothetical protein